MKFPWSRKSATADLVRYDSPAAAPSTAISVQAAARDAIGGTVQTGIRPISNAQNRRMIQARFDNAFTTQDNQQLWALADLMSVDASANFMIRRTLRMRGRYAYHNNPFVMGAANRLGKFVIGSGPKLHMATGSADLNNAVEAAFNRWAERIHLARKLRVMRTARFYNGESFGLLRTNPKIKNPVKLDVHEIEADQVTSPLFGIFPAQYPDQVFDGLILDPWGNKQTYHVLRQHPGAFGAFLVMGYEFDPWPAEFVLHDYGRLRPAQQRGIPEVTPALDLFEEARRFRRAVLGASETAADHAGFIKTDAPPDGADEATPDTGFGTATDYVDIRRRQMGVLPAGWDAFQMKAEQPTTTYEGYMLALLVEASQTLDMPLFILTGDARLANMSSAYVATQGFINSVKCDRQDYAALMDQVLDEWLVEARLAGVIPRDVPDDPEHAWRWDRVSAHADPQKMAAAQNQRLKSGVRSPSLECADDGLEYEEVAERAADDYGVTVKQFKDAVFQSMFAGKGKPVPATLDDEDAAKMGVNMDPGGASPSAGSDTGDGKGPHGPNGGGDGGMAPDEE